MKILFFSSYFYPYTSGITTYPFKIFTHLAKKNKITVLAFNHIKNQKDEQTINGFKILRIPYFIKINKGFISPQSFFYYLKYVMKSDMVFVNQPNFEGLTLVVLAKIFRKKVISIFHCQVFLKNTFLNKIINFFLNKSMVWQMFLSDKIIAYTKDYVSSLMYFKKLINKTRFILPPIEYISPDKKYFNELIKEKKDNIWIGFAGRVSREKGIEYLIEAINKLKVTSKIVLVFAGPFGSNVAGEKNYYLDIKKMLKDYKINHIFLGNLTGNKLSSFYKSINILALPSINQTEAFGIVQAEAMIHGSPVIASNLPGVRIPIELTKMGIVINPKNSSLLKEAIEEIFENQKKYSNEKLVKNAKIIFNINKTYKFYDILVKNNT